MWPQSPASCKLWLKKSCDLTYYEVVEEGFPSARLTDEAWSDRLHAGPRPEAPAWTRSFRLPVLQPPSYLELPTEPQNILRGD
jgi:hypothetical protein